MGVVRDILEAVGQAEIARVRRSIPSRTLRAALRLVIDESRNRAHLFIPHYWAVYLHDGRDGFGPRSAKKLVFFDNPKDDPRIRGARAPERASQLRRLSRREYQKGLEINNERRRRGQRPYMYVVDSVGPATGSKFFDKLGAGSAVRNAPLIARVFDAHIQDMLKAEPDLRPDKQRARFDL